MKVKRLKTWQQFKQSIQDFCDKAEHLNEGETYRSKPLFRGQENSRWRLLTTLERWGTSKITLTEYMQIARSAYVESGFKFKDGQPLETIPKRLDLGFQPLPNLEFLAHLRHHGFPSPLLDWSRSWEVAAAFAFHKKPDPRVKRVAIFAFQEFSGHGKSWSDHIGCISEAHTAENLFPRHTNQKSRYTYCTRRASSKDDYVFFPHQDILLAPRDPGDPPQDLLTKFVLPIECRTEALNDLLNMGITPHFLYGSEDSRIQTLALKHLEHFNCGTTHTSSSSP